MLAALVYASGYRVVHNASLLFAWRVDDMDIIRLGETTEVNMMAVIDELHIHSNRYAQNTLRQRTSVEGLAGLRKNLSPVLGMSQQEHQIAHDWRAEVDAVFYPSRSTPPESQRGSYPPWCWRRIDVAGPQPWRGKMMGEQLGIQVYREGRYHQRVFDSSPGLVRGGEVAVELRTGAARSDAETSTRWRCGRRRSAATSLTLATMTKRWLRTASSTRSRSRWRC